MKLKILLSLLTLLPLLTRTDGISSPGLTPLDSWSFDKILSKFKTSIVKFDQAYPHGDKHDQFAKLAAAGRPSQDLLVAEVGVKDYGDFENEDLAKRFGVKKEDYPVVKMFIQGKDEPINFDDQKFEIDNLINFVRKHSDVYISHENCLEVFDRIVDRFLAVKEDRKRKELVSEALMKIKDLKTKEEKESAEIYLKVMNKILDKGEEFIGQERQRVAKIIEGEKMSKEKKKTLQAKLNILKAFKHDEL